MNVETLDRAVGLAARTGCVFVATADVDGLPHLASAASISHVAAGQVAVTEWFCPGTMANVRDNRRVALVVWDAAEDVGYQLLGRVTKVEELAARRGRGEGHPFQPRAPQRRGGMTRPKGRRDERGPVSAPHRAAPTMTQGKGKRR
jgi:hypothetical protein